jgi:hypothetical protein
MDYRYYDIGTKKVRVNFLSSGMGSSDYNVELCSIGSKFGTRVKKSHEDGAITAREWGCTDAGLTVAEAVQAVELLLAEKHQEYLAWLDEHPEMKAYATA